MKNNMIKQAALTAVAVLSPALSFAGLNYANVPLFWAQGAKPNIVLLIDNSGSMSNMTFSQDYASWLKADPTTSAYKNYDDDWYFCTGWDSTKNECNAVDTIPIAQMYGGFANDTGDVSTDYFNYVASNSSPQLQTGSGTKIIRCNVANGSTIGAYNASGDGLMVTNANPAVAKPSAGTSGSVTYTDTYSFNSTTGVGNNQISFFSEVRTPAGSTVHALAVGDGLVYNNGGCGNLQQRFGFGGLTTGSTYYVRSVNGAAPNQRITLKNGAGQQITFRAAASSCTQTFTLTPQITVAGSGSSGVTVPGSDPVRRVVDACIRLRQANSARNTTTNPTPPSAGTLSAYESTDVRIQTGSTYSVPVSYKMDGNAVSDTWWTTPYIEFLLNKAFEPVTVSTATSTKIPSTNSALVLDMFNPPPGSAYPVVTAGATARVDVPPDNRAQTMRRVALAAIGDNKDIAYFGITSLSNESVAGSPNNNSGNPGKQQVPSGDASVGYNNTSTTTTQWYKLESWLTTVMTPSTSTPLAKALQAIVNNFQNTSGTVETMQYRCQKNFTVIMTDGEPTSDYSSSTYDTDHIPDNIFSGDGYLDDIAEKGYYLDFKTSGNDNAGKLWDTSANAATNPYWQQNLVTYTIGFGERNDLLEMTPAVNRIVIPASNITTQNPLVTDASKNGYLTYTDHMLNDGDVVIYEAISRTTGTLASPTIASTASSLMVQIGGSTVPLPYHAADNEHNTDGKFYAVHLTKDDFALAASYDDAIANPPVTIPIISVGAGSYTFSTGPGHSSFSTSAQELSLSLAQALNQIRALTSSASAVAANSSQLNTSTRVYQATFDTSDWSGNLFSYPIDINTGTVSINSPDWDIQSTITTGNVGTVLTWNPSANTGKGTGTLFSSAAATLSTNFSAGELAALGATTTEQQDIINWVLGQTSGFSTTLRDRPVTIVGDILNSSPQYLGPKDFGYSVIAGSVGTSYQTFLTNNINRRQMLFWGGNDGMLHGVDALSGQQLVAYVPMGVYMDFTDSNNNGVYDTGEPYINKLNSLAQTTYGLTPSNQHQYLVDGTPTIADAQFNDASWHTVLVSGLNAGGRTVFALDVTNTNSFSAASVLWEFSDPRLGHSFSRPVVARMQNGKFAAIFGNGYDSKGDVPRLFIVLLDRQGNGFVEGTNFWVLENSTATYSPNVTPSSNGLSGVAVALDSNMAATTAYAGDIQGNVWRFDLNDPGPSYWTSNSSFSKPFFTAWDDKSPANRQPITVPPVVTKNSVGNNLVIVATGKYFEVNDNSYNSSTSTPHVNTVYGLQDDGTTSSYFNNPTSATGRPTSYLQKQTFSVIPGTIYRTVTNNTMNWWSATNTSGQKGWMEDLVNGTSFQGELVFKTLTLHKNAVIYPTAIPSVGDACTSSGSSYLMEVCYENGGLCGPIFDVNGDGIVTANETPSVGIFNSGGFFSEPVIFDANATNLGAGEVKVMSVAGAGSQAVTVKEAPQTQPPLPKSGRSSWRQLQ